MPGEPTVWLVYTDAPDSPPDKQEAFAWAFTSRRAADRMAARLRANGIPAEGVRVGAMPLNVDPDGIGSHRAFVRDDGSAWLGKFDPLGDPDREPIRIDDFVVGYGRTPAEAQARARSAARDVAHA